jgi:hypothetical protein
MKLIVQTRIHCTTSSQVKCFLSACVHHLFVGRTADRKHFDLGRGSFHNADIYIFYNPFADSENRGKKILKIGFNFVFFSL